MLQVVNVKPALYCQLEWLCRKRGGTGSSPFTLRMQQKDCNTLVLDEIVDDVFGLRTASAVRFKRSVLDSVRVQSIDDDW